MGFPVETEGMECDSWRAIDIAGLEQHDPSACDQTDVPTLTFIGGWSCEVLGMNIAKLKNKAEGLVTQLAAKDECEKRVLDAVSNKSWAAHPTLLNEIAEDTFQFDRYSSVMRLVWKTVESAPRNWRSIAKALILVEHLTKHGAEKVVGDVQQHIHDINALAEFRYFEGHLDRGSGVREKAQKLANLIGNPDRVRAERLKARDLKAQYSGYGAHMSPRPSTGSSRDFSSPRDSHGEMSDTAAGARYSGEISDDWRAAYDRSPTPPEMEGQRVIGGNGGGATSDKIDFDAGREGYSGRLSQYQEKERREASQAGSSRSRRGSRDSGTSQPADATLTAGGGGGQSQTTGGRSAGASKKRDERRPSAVKGNSPSGPDLLSGADPFPASAPRAANDFSSFAAFEPQPLQGGAPVVGGWYGGAGGGPPQQWAPEAAGQMVPYGQSAAGMQNQQQQPQQQQQQQQQQFQGQPAWPPQGLNGLQAGQQAPQALGYGQSVGQGQAQGYGGQFGGQGQQHPQGWPQQQQQQQPNEQQVPRQQGQPQLQQQGYQQYQPQQGYQQPQQGYQQPQQAYQQQQQQQPYPPQQQQQQQQQQPQQVYPPQQQQQQQPVQQLVQQPQAHQQQQQPPQQQQQQQQLHQQQPHHQQQQQQQQQSPPPPPEPQQPPSQTQQSPPLQAQQPPPPQAQAVHQQQAPGSRNSQQGVTVDGDWVPTEVVRAGIAGRDLAAAVADLRQTGFKPSDVGGPSVFSGQGRRGSGLGPSTAATMAVPGSGQRPAAHQKPPQNVEYVEEGQELRAGTSEFLGARSGLNRTGLSGRLQQQQPQHQPSPPPPPQQQQQQQRQVPVASPMASPMASPSAGYQGASPPQGPAQVNKGVVAGAVGQWQGLPRAQQGSGGGGAGAGVGPRASWQTREGGLRSTGLAENSGGGAHNVTASAGQAAGAAQQQGGAAPWQQGAAGLRRTGLVVAGEGGGGGGVGGLDMGKVSLNSGQPQWRT